MAALTAPTPITTLAGVVWRFGGFVVYAAAGLGLGYLLWGTRVGVLMETLNRTIVEQDALRSVMHQQARLIDRIDDAPAVDHGELTALRLRLDETRDELLETRAAAAAAAADFEGQSAQLAECNEVQQNLQSQLETCIFEKAALQRGALAPAPVAERPMSGTSPVSESVEYPKPGTGLVIE